MFFGGKFIGIMKFSIGFLSGGRKEVSHSFSELTYFSIIRREIRDTD